MAQSVFRHRTGRSLPRWHLDDAIGATERAWRSVRLAWRHDPRAVLWRLLWLPFWLGSEAPAPALPGVAAPGAALASDPASDFLADRIDRVTRRFWGAWMAGALLRGLTLALVFTCLWVALALTGAAPAPGPLAVAVLVAGGLAAGAIYAMLVRPDRLMVARMLDRTFGLQERIVTAFDRPGDGGYVSRLQLADAANTLDEVVKEIPRSAYWPVREAAMCLIACAALVTLLLANVPREAIAAVADSPVPQFVPASERLAAREEPPPPPPLAEQPARQESIAEIQERGRRSQSAREDLARIEDALRDHAVTQPAAESIASGDYAAAAESLRAASESAAGMSQASRDALAEDLEAAAQEISAENPELAQAANEAASALREGGPESGAALDGLADQVEATGSQVESQEELARDLDEAQSGASDPGSASEGSSGEPSGSQSQSQSSEQGAGEGQQASDPGEGSSAQPGVSNQPQAPAESGASSGSSEGGAEGESADGAGEGAAEGGEGEGSGEPSSAESSGGEGSGAGQQDLEGAPNDETSAAQGSGAGTGQRGANDQNTSDQPVDEPANTENPEEAEPAGAGSGEAGDPPPSRGARGEEDDATGATSQGAANLELEGVSENGVQTGGDSGSSSLGSGSGSTTASGDQTAGDVGVAGPDSNRVPDTLRDVVQDYFGGPEE